MTASVRFLCKSCSHELVGRPGNRNVYCARCGRVNDLPVQAAPATEPVVFPCRRCAIPLSGRPGQGAHCPECEERNTAPEGAQPQSIDVPVPLFAPVTPVGSMTLIECPSCRQQLRVPTGAPRGPARARHA